MAMSSDYPGYVSFMLRLRKVGRDDESTWRASLENPHTGELLVFPNLQVLFTFLEKTTAELADPRACRRSKLP
jgi:hypothetical protein